MPSSDIKYIHSGMPGAPSLSGAAGSLIALLNACLINGFGLGTLDSLTIAGGVATATRAAGHSHEAGSVAQIAGITGAYAGLNGDRKVLTTSPSTFTFDATGFPDGTATGTITQKMAPLATWTKPFSGTNLAAYRSTDPLGTQMYLRVDDTGTTEARVLGYESMTGINAGTGPFGATSPGSYIAKANNTTGTRAWSLIGDSRGFFLSIAYYNTNQDRATTSYFGDFNPILAGDPYACMLQASTSSYYSTQSGASSDCGGSSNYGTASVTFVPRAYTGLGTYVGMQPSCAIITGSLVSTLAMSGSTDYKTPYPNPTDGGLYITPVRLNETNSRAFRGITPGLYHIPQDLESLQPFYWRDSVTGIAGFLDRTFKTIRNQQSGTPGTFLIDITGPWR